MLTGSWYGRCLAGDAEPDDWPARAAELVWGALSLAPSAAVRLPAWRTPPPSS